MFPIVKVRRQVTAVPCRELFCIMTAYHVPCWHIPSSPSRYISLCQHVKTFMFSYSISHCIVQSLTMSLQKITSQGFSFFFFLFQKIGTGLHLQDKLSLLADAYSRANHNALTLLIPCFFFVN